MNVRIIPRLDIKGPNLVKGVQLEGLRVLGAPESFARYYYEHGADELIYLDVVASLYGRNSLPELIERTAREVHIPLTVGGGLRCLDDIRTVLRAGADKVALNTAALRCPALIQEASHRFGASTIVVSIEAKQQPDGTYEAYTDNGRERTGVEVQAWAVRAAELGAGEILLTSIDREGTGSGFDVELTRTVAEAVPIPVIACGGAGQVRDIQEVITLGKADAVSVASLLHYACVTHLPYTHDVMEGNTEFLRHRQGLPHLPGATIAEIKQFLIQHGIACRDEAWEGHYA
jgi:cyclase